MELSAERLSPEHFPKLKKLHDEQHNFAWKDPVLDFGSIVVKKDGEVIGGGFLHPLLEATMILDLTQDHRTKCLALKKMIQQSVLDAKSIGFREIFAWANDPEFAKLIVKHFGYKQLPGTSLIQRV